MHNSLLEGSIVDRVSQKDSKEDDDLGTGLAKKPSRNTAIHMQVGLGR